MFAEVAVELPSVVPGQNGKVDLALSSVSAHLQNRRQQVSMCSSWKLFTIMSLSKSFHASRINWTISRRGGARMFTAAVNVCWPFAINSSFQWLGFEWFVPWSIGCLNIFSTSPGYKYRIYLGAIELLFKGPVLAIMLRAPLLLFCFSRKRGVHCY